MSSRFFTPSMGVACLALAAALSGTAYAVTRLPANSVGTNRSSTTRFSESTSAWDVAARPAWGT
jgi:hypothetical protein